MFDWADNKAQELLKEIATHFPGDPERLRLAQALREAWKEGWQDCYVKRPYDLKPHVTSELINTVDISRRPGPHEES